MNDITSAAGGPREAESDPSASSGSGVVAKIFLYAIPIAGVGYTLGVPEYLGVALWREQFGLLILGFALTAIFLTVPMRVGKPSSSLLDVGLAIVALVVCGYTAWNYEALISYGYAVPGIEGAVKLVFAGTTIVLVIEGVRRMTGWILVGLVVVALAYAKFSEYVPGALRGTPNDVDHILIYLHLDPAGILGVPLGVTVTTVLAYVLLGNALFRLGGGQLFLDLALGSMGRYRGGAAKASVLASSLFGSISGSAVANVVTTGIVTIPLMKRSGLDPERAGAVEAVASTGGQLLPPIMGAAAFIMADFLSVPYATVALAALMPALLFYVAIFAQIHLRATRMGMPRLEAEERPSLRSALRARWTFLIPLVVLLYVLFFTGRQPAEAAIVAVVLVYLAAWMSPQDRPDLRRMLSVFEHTGRSLLDIIMIVAAAGVVIGVLNVSGLAFSLALVLLEVTDGNIVILLVISAVVALVLGMGMPTTAVYVLMASLVAPALVKGGLNPIGAHLFVLYFGVLSMITPPICLAAFTAASIAKGHYMRTGVESIKLGAVAFFVPFLFVFSPALLLQGESYLLALWAFLTGIAGCIFLAGAFEGYLVGLLSLPLRVASALIGASLLLPAGLQISDIPTVYTDAAGIVFGLPLIVYLWFRRRATRIGEAKT
jgi:TRAP transporter 4TM/12TM fusion protein